MKPAKWYAWEYRVLAEGHDVSRTAKLLKRTEGDVGSKLDASLGFWYRRNRIPGSPESVRRLVCMAYAIWDRDFRDDIDQDSLESRIIGTLTFCFRGFDPAKGDTKRPIQDRFVKHFAHWFSRHLKDSLRDATSERRKATLRYLNNKAGWKPYDEVEDEYAEWCRLVKERAVSRLDKEAQDFIALHWMGHHSMKDTAEKMGLTERTLYRRFGGDRIIVLIKEQITCMITQISDENMEQLVWTLYFDKKFSKDKIAILFNVPQPYIDKVVRAVTDKVFERIELSAGERLFEVA